MPALAAQCVLYDEEQIVAHRFATSANVQLRFLAYQSVSRTKTRARNVISGRRIIAPRFVIPEYVIGSVPQLPTLNRRTSPVQSVSHEYYVDHPAQLGDANEYRGENSQGLLEHCRKVDSRDRCRPHESRSRLPLFI